jgi:hypothetical protein
LNLPATIPVHASQMYAKNLQNLLALMLTKDGRFQPDWDDDIVAATVITRDGEVVHEGTRKRLGLEPLAKPEPEPEPEPEAEPDVAAEAEPAVTAAEQPTVSTAAAAAATTGAAVESTPVEDAETTPVDRLDSASLGGATNAAEEAVPWIGSEAAALPDLPEPAPEPGTAPEPESGAIPMPAPAAEAGPDDALAFMNEDEARNPIDAEPSANPDPTAGEPATRRRPRREPGSPGSPGSQG